MYYIKWLSVLVVLSCVGRISRCKSVAILKLIKRMDLCNMSQHRVNKSGAVTGLLSPFIQRDEPLAAVHTDKGWLQRGAAKYRNANLNKWHSKLTQLVWSNGVKEKHISLSLRLYLSPSIYIYCQNLSFHKFRSSLLLSPPLYLLQWNI